MLTVMQSSSYIEMPRPHLTSHSDAECFFSNDFMSLTSAVTLVLMSSTACTTRPSSAHGACGMCRSPLAGSARIRTHVAYSQSSTVHHDLQIRGATTPARHADRARMCMESGAPRHMWAVDDVVAVCTQKACRDVIARLRTCICTHLDERVCCRLVQFTHAAAAVVTDEGRASKRKKHNAAGSANRRLWLRS